MNSEEAVKELIETLMKLAKKGAKIELEGVQITAEKIEIERIKEKEAGGK